MNNQLLNLNNYINNTTTTTSTTSTTTSNNSNNIKSFDHSYSGSLTSNNEINNTLWFKIWRNCYLKSKILRFLKLINIHFQRRIYSIETHLNYQYKDYLRYVLLDFKDKEQLVQLLKTLPSNIKSVSLNYFRFKERLEPGTIPESITEFKFNGLYDAPLNSKLFSSSIKSLVLPSRFNQPLIPLPNNNQNDEINNSGSNNQNENPIKSNYIDDFEKIKNKLKFSSGTDDEKMSSYEEDDDGATVINTSNYSSTFSGSNSVTSSTSTSSTTNLEHLNQNNGYSFNGYQSNNNSIVKEGFQLPISLTFLSLGLDFQYPIEVGVLPKTLLKLKFGSIYNHPIKQSVLPTSLTELALGDSFNQPLPKGILGPNLKKLELGFYWDQPLKTDYDLDENDSTLTHFPDSLEILKFGRSFNRTIGIGSLPKSLTILDFCWIGSFNKPLEPRVLPNGLKILKLSRNWLQSLHSNTLPSSITVLQFNTDTYRTDNVNNILDLNITKSIPPSVTKLSLGNLKESIVPFSLPSSITSLHCGSDQKIFTYSIPESVKILSGINKKYFEFIPPTVTKLKYNNYKDPIITTNSNLIPQFITSLHLGLEYNSPFNNQLLSKLTNLQELYFGIDFNHPLDVLPPNLKTLCLSLCFNYKIDKGVLPESLTALRIGSDYRHGFEKDVLPKGLLLLELGSNFNFDLPLSYIPSIKTIIIRGRPNLVLEERVSIIDGEEDIDYIIPESLRSIIIFSNNTQFINKVYLNPYFFNYIKIICSSKVISKNGKLFKKINDTLINQQ